MTPRYRRHAAVALSLLAAATTIAACSGGGETTGEGASCAAASPADYLAWAKIAFDGVMLPGPTISMGQDNVLASPARVRVVRYLKGGGPRVVTVVTGVRQHGDGVIVNEDGLQATAGQRWRIYATTAKMPYDTSICSGTAPLAAGS